MQPVVVENPSDGGFFYWLAKFYAFGLACLGVLGLYAMGAAYLYFAAGAPELPDLDTYARRVPGVTQVFGHDGTLLAELTTQRRELVPVGKIPEELVHAFSGLKR